MNSSVRVLITGGTKGIGRATAERFAKDGWSVAVIARSKADLAAMQAHWEVSYSTPLVELPFDLQSAKQTETAIAQVREQWGEIEVLINNVGRFMPARLLGESDLLADFFRVNVFAAYQLCRAFVPAMLEAGRGRVIHLGSVATIDHPPHMGVYTASKYALWGLHRALQQELIDTAVISKMVIPGATYTDSWKGVEVDPATLLTPTEIAEAVYQQATAAEADTPDEWVIRPNQQ